MVTDPYMPEHMYVSEGTPALQMLALLWARKALGEGWLFSKRKMV